MSSNNNIIVNNVYVNDVPTELENLQKTRANNNSTEH